MSHHKSIRSNYIVRFPGCWIGRYRFLLASILVRSNSIRFFLILHISKNEISQAEPMISDKIKRKIIIACHYILSNTLDLEK